MQVPSARQITRLVLMAGAAATLSACAAIPHLGPEPKPKAPDAYATSQSFAAPAAEWPSDRWWTAYGDHQLDTLIDDALKGSPTLVQAQARMRQSEALAEQAGAALGPSINADASVLTAKQSYNQGVPKDFIPHGWKGVGRVGLSLSWQLDFFGKNRALLAAATSEAEAARADAAAARLALSTGVAGAYADLAQLYADRDAAEEAVRVRRESEALIGRRFEQQLETKAALERARTSRASSEAELVAMDEAIGLTRNRVAALLGQGPDRGLAIARPAPGAIRAFGLPTNLRADLVGRRPDVVAARLTAQAAAKRIKAAKADFYPDVNLLASIGLQSVGLDMLAKSSSISGAAGPAATLPIFDSGRLQGAYREKRAGYDAAVATYDQTLTQALKEVADSVVSFRALDGRLAKTREALAASQTAYDLSRQSYEHGVVTYLDVLTAEDALVTSRRAVADLETHAFTLDVALIRALGGGYRA
jgi:NodT family efflux transporter outer membrane factor (OMF) lipoprotein